MVVLDRGTFLGAHPLQVRSFVVKKACGLVIAAHREAWKAVPVDSEVLAMLPFAPLDESYLWLTSLPRGGPAKALARALIAFARGEPLLGSHRPSAAAG